MVSRPDGWRYSITILKTDGKQAKTGCKLEWVNFRYRIVVGGKMG